MACLARENRDGRVSMAARPAMASVEVRARSTGCGRESSGGLMLSSGCSLGFVVATVRARGATGGLEGVASAA